MPTRRHWHIELNTACRVPTRAATRDGRVKMMPWWADYLDTLRQRGCVVSLKAVTA